MNTVPLIVIACGASKRTQPAPAADLYTGSLFRSSLAWARSVAPDDRIRILSAKHGLVRLNQVLMPYDIRLGQADAMSPDGVHVQAADEGLLKESDVIVVGGKDYVRFARRVWPHARAPFAPDGGLIEGRPSLGALRSALKTWCGRLPQEVAA